MVSKLEEYFQKKYLKFRENSKVSIINKKKATILKNNAFKQVDGILKNIFTEVY